jgi:hypothetical protein
MSDNSSPLDASDVGTISSVPLVVRSSALYSGAIPLWKFALLSIVTAGIYELVWFYRQWKFLKTETGADISPFWRAFFGAFFSGSLAGRLRDHLRSKSIPCAFSPTVIGISYFVLTILVQLPDPYWLVSYLTFVPLLPLVSAMNRYWSQEAPDLPSEPFAWWQIVLIVLGIALFFSVIV